MSFDKDYPNRKDKRKPYLNSYGKNTKPRGCRPGGHCPYCQSNRRHQQKKADISFKQDMKDV